MGVIGVDGGSHTFDVLVIVVLVMAPHAMAAKGTVLKTLDRLF